MSTALKRVMEKAASTLPDIQVVISTLLPRQDFHPVLIQRVNASISRDCALNPMFSLHTTPPWSSTASTTRYTSTGQRSRSALNRQPKTSHRTSRATGIPPRPTSRGPPASRPPPGPGGPLPPKRPLPPRPHHHGPSIHTHTPWSLFDAVIGPIALYSCEVWGPLTNQDFVKWDNQLIETFMQNSANQY